MNVANLGDKVLYGCITRLAVISVGVVNVPKSRKIVACKSVKHSAESCRVGVNSARFYKNTYLFLGCYGQKLVDCGANLFLVVGKCANYDVGNSCTVCNINKSLKSAYCRIVGGYVKRCIKAGNRSFSFLKQASGCANVVFVKGAILFGHGVKL